MTDTQLGPPIESEVIQRDLFDFTRLMLKSRDIDPLYPFLKKLYEHLEFNEEDALRFTVYYVGFYNVASAYYAWTHGLASEGVTKLPIAVERRGLRGGRYIRHFVDWQRLAGPSIKDYLENALLADWTRGNYDILWDRVQEPWGNGRWAAFKMLDILRNVHGFPVEAPDMRMQFCTGPKECLEWLYALPRGSKVNLLTSHGNKLRSLFETAGIRLQWEELETILCNFGSMRKGRYYVGHDIDELQHVIESSALDQYSKGRLMAVRLASLPHDYLGELHDYHGGVNKQLAQTYLKYGVITRR